MLDELIPALGHIAAEEFGVRFCQGAEPDWSDKSEAEELIDEITEGTFAFLKAQMEAYWDFGRKLAEQEGGEMVETKEQCGMVEITRYSTKNGIKTSTFWNGRKMWIESARKPVEITVQIRREPGREALEDQLMKDFKKFIRKLNRRAEKSGDQKMGYRVELV